MEYNKNLKENNPYSEQNPNKEAIIAAEQVVEKENVVTPETGVGEEQLLTVTPEEEERLSKELEEKLQESNESNSSGDSGASSSGASASASGSIAAGAAAGAAVVVVAVAVAVSAIAGAAINDITLTGTALSYNVGIEVEYTLPEEEEFYDVDFTNFDTGAQLVVYNNNFEEVIPLVMGSDSCVGVLDSTEQKSEHQYSLFFSFSGEVSGLSPNTRYKVEIVGSKSGGGVTTYDSQTVKTLDYQTSISGILYECRCDTIDHTFLFKLDYVDENGYYGDFSYLLAPSETNSLGTVDAFGEMTEPMLWQTVYNANTMAGIYYDLTIIFTSTADTDLEKIGTTENLNGTIIQYVQGEAQGETIISITIQVEI